MRKLIIGYLFWFLCSATLCSQTANGYYGILNAKKVYVKSFNSQTYSISTTDAVFTYTPSSRISFNSGRKAGNVKFNNKAIDFVQLNTHPNNEHWGYYIDQTNTLNLNTQDWFISGHAQEIPNFTFQNTSPFPSIDFPLSFPDTLRKSDSLVITLSNISDADSIAMFISDQNQSNPKDIMILMASSTESFYLTPAMLGPLGLSNEAYVSFEAINYTITNVNGKKFCFRNSSEIFKPKVKIVN